MAPTVSVIIPCYNHGFYLAEAVLSILQQSYSDTECIIVNDGSSDVTDDVAARLISQYPARRITLLSKKNEGVVAARRDGAAKASGELLLFLDADDAIHPKFIEEAAAVLQSNSSVGFVYSAVQHIGSRCDIWCGGPFSPLKMLFENQLAITALLRRKMYEEVGGFKTIMEKGFEDWEFWIACIERGWAGFLIDKPYFYYRKHSPDSRLTGLEEGHKKELIQRIIELHPALYAAALQELQAEKKPDSKL